MAMDDNVDMVIFHHAKVSFGLQRRGAAEHDVLEVGGDHGAAPAVSQGTASRLLGQVDKILIHTHRGPVHDFNDLAVDGPRLDAFLLPLVLERLRSTLQIGQGAIVLTELGHGGLGNAQGDLVDIAVQGLAVHLYRSGHIKIRSDLDQLGRVLDLVVFGLLAGNREEGLDHAAAMI